MNMKRIHILYYNFFKILNLCVQKFIIISLENVYIKYEEIFSLVPFVCDVRSCI
jgi:hypothetical protein